MRRTARLALAIGFGSILSISIFSTESLAIPAFARKYETSCQTCHIAYPKLNAFGEAFRLNGYRYPDETENQVKEKPVSMGAQAWKLVWPDGVWPGSIPSNSPWAFRTNFNTNYSSKTEDHGREFIKWDFAFPPAVELLAGGTLGDDMSFFVGLEFEQEVEDGELRSMAMIHQAELHWNDLFGHRDLLNIKIGFFEPELVSGFSHMRRLTFSDYSPLFSYLPVGPDGGEGIGGGGHHGGGGAGLAVPKKVTGLELYGIVNHRFLYTAGIAAGQGPGAESYDGNTAKDYYAKVSYKIGGMGLDGTTMGGAGAEPVETENWIDNSLKLSLFGYFGNGEDIQYSIGTQPALLEDISFNRIGFDASMYIGNLNVFGTILSGSDVLREGGDSSTDRTFSYSAMFVEANYVIKPWIIGVLRYETLTPASDHAESYEMLIPNLTLLLRANVKFIMEFQQNMVNKDNYTFMAGVDFAF